ncbi:MAG: hypothetical protein JW822_08675 [Spirochaetales bacterium]|nr:hypothetical protein [Spirochaetales bacterium]
MKKYFIIPLLVLLLVAVGCKSTPKDKGNGDTTPTSDLMKPPPEPIIISHQYKGLGEVPEWVLMPIGKIEELPEHRGYYVFKESFSGRNLEGTKIQAQNFSVDDQIARMVSVRIQSKYAGAIVGDSDMAEQYFEKVVKSIAEGRVGGSKKYDEYWVQRRYFKDENTVDKEVFEYYLLVRVPMSEIKAAIARAFDGNKPKSEEETRARDLVKDALEDLD